jgi:hypothetical protein
MKKIRSFLLYFFIYPGLLLSTNEGYAQFSQSVYSGKEKDDQGIAFFYSGNFNELTEADSIIDLQFQFENEPDIFGDSFQSSPFNPGTLELQIKRGSFRFYDPSHDFTSSPGNAGIFENQFLFPDNFRLRNQDASIWKKMGRAQIFIGGTELLCMGILMAMPKEVTKWEPGFLESAKKNLKLAFTTMPENDEDDWGFNYVGHPIAGSLYYNAIRSQDATIFQSFLFSFSQSAIWEYVIEGMAEQPSVQDLIITPIFGTLLGEASHMATIGMRRNGFNWLEKITVIVINPFYVVNNGFRTTNKKVITK